MENTHSVTGPQAMQVCENCGVRKRPERLTLAYMLLRLKDDIFGIERGLIQTILHLFVKPAEVTLGFITGNNLRYYSPIKYLIVAATISLFLSRDTPFLDHTIVAFLVNKKLGDTAQVSAFVQNWNTLLYAPMIFFLALSTRIFFRDARLNYAEHLVVATYGWSQLLLIGVVMTLILKLCWLLGIKGSGLFFLLLMPPAYWFWYCTTIFKQHHLGGWMRAFIILPFTITAYLFLFIASVSIYMITMKMF